MSGEDREGMEGMDNFPFSSLQSECSSLSFVIFFYNKLVSYSNKLIDSKGEEVKGTFNYSQVGQKLWVTW